MTGNAELKPCPNPWCAEPGKLQIVWDLYRRRVHCISCGIYGPSSTGMNVDVPDGELDSQAIAAWNIRADLAKPKVKPLDFPERRHGYWGHKGGYQVAYTSVDNYRVRLHGKVICRDIKGFDRAVEWANNHNESRILAALDMEAE